MPTVVVVGGGVSGLAAAWAARQAGARVLLLEATARFGGVITSVRSGGYLAELGPTSMLETPAAAALVESLGIGGERLTTAAAARRRYVLRGGRPVAIPTSPVAFCTSPLLPVAARLRALLEPLVPRRRGDSEESVASLVERRFGRAVLDVLVDPFVSGVYAGDPARLSARHAMGRLSELERTHGSVMLGAVRSMRAARAAGRPRPPMVSFRGGLARLPAALARSLGSAARSGARVRRVSRDAAGWRVEFDDAGGPREAHADAVVIATPAHALAGLGLPAPLAATLAPVSAVAHAAVATVALGFRRDQVAHALDGFGVLAPSAERCGVLGVLFNSSLFEGRAPADHVQVTCFVGGARSPAAALEGHDALVRRAVDAISPMLGVHGAPTMAHSAAWARAIPQYELGHGAVEAAAAQAEREAPGLRLAGSWRRGVSIGDCIALGVEAGRAAVGVAQVADRAAAWEGERVADRSPARGVGTVRFGTASIAEPGPLVA